MRYKRRGTCVSYSYCCETCPDTRQVTCRSSREQAVLDVSPRLCSALSLTSAIERHSATLSQLALQDESLGAVDALSTADGILERLASQHHRVREL
jgi:hypothetical protein